MFESLKKTIEDSEALTAKLKHLNERVQVLVDSAKKEQNEINKQIIILERAINDLIFDQKNKKVDLPKIPSVDDCLFRHTDSYKPMGLSCPCPRCSPYSISFGVISGISDPERLSQVFKNKNEAGSYSHMVINKPKE